MAEGHSMTIPDVVAKVLSGEHGDFLREAVAVLARELMEAEIAGEIGACSRSSVIAASSSIRSTSARICG